MNLVVVTFIVLTMNSCKKTQFQPVNLVGTWTMTEEIETSTSFKEILDNFGTNNPIKTETTTDLTYSQSGLTGQVTTRYFYDTAVTDGYVSYTEKEEFKNNTYVNNVTTDIFQDSSNVATSSTSSFEADLQASKDYKITFNKDRSFTISNQAKIVYERKQGDTGYNSTTEVVKEKITEISGSWAFIGADKIAGEANKERIGLWFSNSNIEDINKTIETFVDSEPSDSIDFTLRNSDFVSNSKSFFVSNQVGTPDLVWKMLEGSSNTMTITSVSNFDINEKLTSIIKDLSGTNTSIINLENNLNSINKITFSK